MSGNKKFLIEDYYRSNYFVDKYQSESILYHSNNVIELQKIFFKKLRDVVKADIDISNINNLHHHLSSEQKEYDINFGINKISTFFYDMPTVFKKKYINLLKDIRNFLNEDFYFQDNPTIRVLSPHHSQKQFHPFFHCDALVGHPPYEINVWFPLNTPSNSEGYGFGISSLKDSHKIIEKYNFDINEIIKNKKKVADDLVKKSELQKFAFGNILLFDSRKFHSALLLKNHTRISIDVRVVVCRIYNEFLHEYQGTGKRKVIYKPGNGYNAKSIDNYI